MTIKDQKLRDLYERYMNFINGNYIYAVINETANTVSISYAGELARIIIKCHPDIKSLSVKITQDPTKKMSDKNGKLYYMSTIDEMNQLISASRVIMDLKVGVEMSGGSRIAQEAMEGQGYLLDNNENMLGVVDLRFIPTNAFIYDADVVNEETHEEHAEQKTEKQPFKKSLLKFFS